MKLPKLPKLPSTKRPATQTDASDQRKLPSLKSMPGRTNSSSSSKSKQGDVPEYSRVTRNESGWGGDTWFETGRMSKGKAEVGGTCSKCESKVRAIDLKLRRQKDGTEIWVCEACT